MSEEKNMDKEQPISEEQEASAAKKGALSVTTAGVIAVVVAATAFWAGTFYQTRAMMAGGPGMMMRAPGGMASGPRIFRGGPGGGGGFGRGGEESRRGGPGGEGGPGGVGGPGIAMGGERLISGRLDKVEDNQLTLTTRFGSVKVDFDSGAEISRARKASSVNLKSGQDIIVTTEIEKDGKMTAKAVVVK